ncbi:MAG: GyrI-like domain-containing protein [Oscillospiraceae bacterium]|jgi:hypothetical protein|nr:GyrI-like domain-containing protein [Oscillospiraceae bacterium]
MNEPLKQPKPESHTPKDVPEILKMAAQSSQQTLPAIQPAPATIKAKARNQVRIIELPACKMVTSGAVNGADAFAPGGALARFCDWFAAYDKQRADLFYVRDFLWSAPNGGFQWGYAVAEIPEDTGGFDVIDFPGGLYAVAISVDADGKDHDRVHSGMQEWVKKSGCFALDETDTRRSLGTVTSPEYIKDILGYQQMDLYVPIKIKEESK